MFIKNKKSLKSLEKNRKVTRMPNWFLKLKGKYDSSKGSGVCDHFLKKLIKNEALLESSKIIDAENVLFETRKSGALALLTLYETKANILDLPEDVKGETSEAIRFNRRNAAKRIAAQGVMKTAIESLSQINETIISIETVLDERLMWLRNHTSEKTHIYLSGIHSGKLKDYVFSRDSYDDKSRIIYREKHKNLDAKIQSAVYNVTGGDAV